VGVQAGDAGGLGGDQAMEIHGQHAGFPDEHHRQHRKSIVIF
jgi:hypothetical protein